MSRAPTTPPTDPLESAQGPEPSGLEELALVSLWSTGGDPERDELFRIQALKRDGTRWRCFDLFVAPVGSADPAGDLEAPVPVEPGDQAERAEPESSSSGSAAKLRRATRRMQREFGVTAADLEGAPLAKDAWAALADFLGPFGSFPLLVARRDEFQAWARSLDPSDNPFAEDFAGAARLVSLEEFRALLAPGCSPAALPRDPEALLAEFGDALADFAALPAQVLSLAARGLAAAAQGLSAKAGEETAAGALVLALTLVEHPVYWSRPSEGLFEGSLDDGIFSRALEHHPDPETALAKARPRWHLSFAELEKIPPIQPIKEGTGPLSPADRERVDQIFGVHLPKHFAAGSASTPGPGSSRGPKAEPRVREGQRQVAMEVAGCLGKGELLLTHAPTGTGKTLAYLVPFALWAVRQGLRVGVATFTRALQDQAAEREVPLALAMLRLAGVAEVPKIVRLKGRSNYLCWRALTRLLPSEEDAEQAPEDRSAAAATQLAWVAGLLFAATSPDGDLDSFPMGLALPIKDPDLMRVARTNLLRSLRGETGCCSSGRDRSTCGAEVARRLAERAHVVIANHSFVLSRQEFVRHVVFDECEHLHNQARSAWSHELSLGALGRELSELFRSRSARGPLGEALGAAPDGSMIEGLASSVIDRHGRVRASVAQLEVQLAHFADWRRVEERRREPRDRHGVFREYVERGPSGALVAAHRDLLHDMASLDAGLASLLEHMDELPTRRRELLRGKLTTRRLALLDAAECLDAWLPRDEEVATGQPRMLPEVFYDVDEDDPGYGSRRGGARLKAQVLLPQEDLGMRYFPELESAVLLSATTWIKGGFQASAGYLGLARTAEPREDENREPRPHRTLFVPEVFDYGRVLVGVPRDAPSVRDRDGYLGYTTRFLAHLAERTRGRVLALFTNARDLAEVGRQLTESLAGTRVPVFWQGMGHGKEELAERFRTTTDSVLLGLDTFWYGADFPGETLEYLVIARLPFGVPDDYHHAQEANMGSSEQRRQIYMPRALARFRQGFGRLMRRESDKGCVFVLDKRVIEPRQRAFLGELPIADALSGSDQGARLVRGDTDFVLHEAFAHMEMLPDIRRRGLDTSFAPGPSSAPARAGAATRRPDPPEPEQPLFFPTEDLPF